MLKHVAALFRLCRAKMSVEDSHRDYWERRHALGMRDNDPRSSAEVAVCYGIPEDEWLSSRWGDWDVQKLKQVVQNAILDAQELEDLAGERGTVDMRSVRR